MLSPHRLLRLLPLIALLSPSLAGAELYPTDRCATLKLRAAARQCRLTFGAWAAAGSAATERETRLADARSRLVDAWQAAEDESAAAGVDCSETGIAAEDLADQIEGAVQAVAEPHLASCDGSLLRDAARACSRLVRADAWHLEIRSYDRQRERLERSRGNALSWFDERVAAAASTWVDETVPGDPASALADTAREAVVSVLVSPQVATEWTQITPPETVQYLDRSLGAICSGGTPYVHFARRGTVNKLLVYYQGGGACWDQVTCAGVPELGIGPTFKQSTGPGDNPSNFSGTGFNDLTDPANPFRDWNIVFIPYCTGDVHWGDATYEHTSPRGNITIEHKGYVNAQVVEKWTREHFVNPDEIFVTGSSAGAYGAIVNSLPMQEYVYPPSPFAVLGDAGNGVITNSFLQNDLAKWGIEKNLPSWIPAFDVPLTELDASDLWVASAEFYPSSRFANYTSAYDGGFGGQTGFYNVMLNRENVLAWPQWWNSSCQWNEEMRLLALDAAARAPNYRYYIGTGSRHTMWGWTGVYDDTTSGVPTLADWVGQMVTGGPGWTNVECTDCDIVLPGNPRPNPPEAPFTDEDRIDCSPE